jgi:hypothetical protein
MPLIMGNWDLYMDRSKGTLTLTNIDATGHFVAMIAPTLMLELFGGDFGQVGGSGATGFGFWDEAGKEISFHVMLLPGQAPDVRMLVYCHGYQIEGPTPEDPGQDVIVTLAGSFHGATSSGVALAPVPRMNTRRMRLGWYAQIRQVV